MRIKLGRKEVTLQEGDYVIDNQACLQIITKSKEAKVWGDWSGSNPCLSKKEFKRFLKECNYMIKKSKKHSFVIYYVYLSDKE